MASKILAVDDEPLMQKLLQTTFRRQRVDFDAVYASDGIEGLQKFTSDIQLVLTDIRMPRMDGISMAREMRQQRGEVKIIVVSAFDDPQHRRDCAEIGVSEYLVKPIQPVLLSKRIESLLTEIHAEQLGL